MEKTTKKSSVSYSHVLEWKCSIDTSGDGEPEGCCLDEFGEMMKRKHPTAIGVAKEEKTLIDDFKMFSPA